LGYLLELNRQIWPYFSPKNTVEIWRLKNQKTFIYLFIYLFVAILDLFKLARAEFSPKKKKQKQKQKKKKKERLLASDTP
jgi:hypothetical protein